MTAKRTVIGQYLNADGTPVKGYIEFTPSSTLASDHIIPVSPVRVVLDDTGSFSCELTVTDDPLMIPTGWKWSVEEKIPNGQQWYLDVPTSATPLDIATCYVIGGNGGPFYVVQGAQGPQGEPGPEGPQGPAGELTIDAGDSRYVNNTGDTMTGNLSIDRNGSGQAAAILLFSDGNSQVGFYTDSLPRFTFESVDTNLYLHSYNDDGSWKGLALNIQRSNLAASFGGDITTPYGNFFGQGVILSRSGGGFLHFVREQTGHSRVGFAYNSTDDKVYITRYDINTGAWLDTIFGINPATGYLEIYKNPVGLYDAVNKNYVDSQNELRLPLSGGTMTGSITMSGTSVVHGEFTTRPSAAAGAQYNGTLWFDGLDRAAVRKAQTGNLIPLWVATPTDNNDATTKLYVDTADALRVAKSGDGMTGPLSLGSGAQALLLYAGATLDHVYMAFYADSAAQGTRSGFIGYAAAGATDLSINNEMPNGNINITANGTGKVLVTGELNTTERSIASGTVETSQDHYYSGIRRWKDSRKPDEWAIGRYDAAGTYIEAAISILNSTGVVAVKKLTIANAPASANDGATKAYVDAVATTTNFTPTIGGFTVNSQDCKYARSNGIVQVGLFFNVATVTGPVTITLPVTPHSSVDGAIVPVSLRDTGVYTFEGYGIIDRSNNRIRVYGIVASTPGRLVDVSSTVPWTWNSGDIIAASFSYLV